MDRVKGLPTFAVITIVVFGLLRLLHVGTPIVFPGIRPGPVLVASLDEARQRTGFAAIVPAYHPASLGGAPSSIAVHAAPTPAITVVWRQAEHYLSVVQQRGGPQPDHPPLAQPLDGVPDSLWWTTGTEHHLLVWRIGYWIELTTSLPVRDLRRFADTLTQQ